MTFSTRRTARPQEESLNYSISQLEYNFANALYKLSLGAKEVIAFTVGHGELGENERKEMVKSLRSYYEVGTFNLDSSTVIPPQVKVLIVAKPRIPFSDRDKFLMDQYAMNGGKIIWLIDRLNVELDSMRRTNNYVARDYDLGLDGMLFSYGVRVSILIWYLTFNVPVFLWSLIQPGNKISSNGITIPLWFPV